ncbi:hypothetical protein J2S97_002037 [Arthrobacter oryzae]|nr:hypothetical protein [Arthrobacter oryzae]
MILGFGTRRHFSWFALLDLSPDLVLELAKEGLVRCASPPWLSHMTAHLADTTRIYE